MGLNIDVYTHTNNTGEVGFCGVLDGLLWYRSTAWLQGAGPSVRLLNKLDDTRWHWSPASMRRWSGSTTARCSAVSRLIFVQNSALTFNKITDHYRK